MSGDIGLGRLIQGAASKDAVHIAVAPVQSRKPLERGQLVKFDYGDPSPYDDDGYYVVPADKRSEALGYVDIYLEKDPEAEERFYVMLFPGTVLSMKHVWTHPLFHGKNLPLANQAAIAQANAEIARIAEDVYSGNGYYSNPGGLTAADLVSAAKDYVNHGEYWNEGPLFEGVYLDQRFWEHYELATGQLVPEGKRGSFFTCSC